MKEGKEQNRGRVQGQSKHQSQVEVSVHHSKVLGRKVESGKESTADVKKRYLDGGLSRNLERFC